MTHELNSLKESLVKLGVDKVEHTDGDLIAHMLNVYRYLEQWNRPEHVSLAGLFHGIYGTHALQGELAFSLSPGQREEVRTLIGEAAERLVYTYSVMTYESLGKSIRKSLKTAGPQEVWDRCHNCPIKLTEQEFNDLLWLKFADLLAHIPKLTGEEQNRVYVEYVPFWEVVADYLGPVAANALNQVWSEHSASQNSYREGNLCEAK